MQSAKDIAASAKAGMEKTKATMQEKAEKMTTRDPLQKEMATEKKEERIHEAERQKHATRAAAGDYPTGGGAGYTAAAEGEDVLSEYPQGTTTTTTTGAVGSEYPTTGGAGRVRGQDPKTGGTY